jgi:hypothetical protein
MTVLKLQRVADLADGVLHDAGAYLRQASMDSEESLELAKKSLIEAYKRVTEVQTLLTTVLKEEEW